MTSQPSPLFGIKRQAWACCLCCTFGAWYPCEPHFEPCPACQVSTDV